MTSRATHPLDYFDCVCIINLESRPDRRRQMQSELSMIGFSSPNLEWFEAIQPDSKGSFGSIGARGCFLSHLGVLAKAAEQNIARLLLLEDDVDFVNNFNARMRIIVRQLSTTRWEMFYGGGFVNDRIPISSDLSRVDPATPVGGSHCVAIHGDAIRRVHDYIAAQLGRAPGDPAGGPMHVDGSYSWARRDLLLGTLIANPDVCFQRSSRSDVNSSHWWDKVFGVREAAGSLREVKRWMTRRR